MAVTAWPLLSPWPTTPAAVTAATTALAEAIGASESVAGRLGPVVAAIVERHAAGAPAAVKSEAVIRCAGWLFSSKPGAAENRYLERGHRVFGGAIRAS